MNVVVTGSSGKIGQCAVAALQQAGHDVICFDIKSPAGGIETKIVDCNDYEQLHHALSNCGVKGGAPDAVVHLAGIIHSSLQPSSPQFFEQNVNSAHNIFFCMFTDRHQSYCLGIERNHFRDSREVATGVCTT